MTMNRLVHVLRNASKTLIVGLSLAVLPWLGSIYFCPRITDLKLTVDSPPPKKTADAGTSSPQLLPSNDSVRCLLTGVVRSEPILAADFSARQIADLPAQHTSSNNLADGPSLADQSQTAKTPSAYIPPSGIVTERNYDESSADSSPPVWTPMEMPIEEKTAESSPEPKTTETLVESDSSAVSTPAVQDTAVDSQSQAPETDQVISYPSTRPLLARRAAAKDLPVRSEQLESIARQADRQTRHGFELAGRGAYYAARAECIAALRLLAQGLDTEGRTNIHGKSLAAGLTALKEAEDFIPGGSRLEADLDLPGIIASHATPVLKAEDKASVTTLTALKSYFTFAQERLAQAAGSEVAGSMALHALGKLHEELAKRKGSDVKAPEAKAMVYYQASLLVFPQNYMAANDLGAMLARNGNYEDARKMLEHSLSSCKQATVWHNLAVVYERLGRGEKARQARQQALIALQTEQASRQKMLVSAGNQVRWVDENTFAQVNKPSELPQGVPAGPVSKPIMQQAGPVPTLTPRIAQPSGNRNWTAADIKQTPSAVSRTLPAMSPTTTGWLPKTPYDARR